MAAVAIWSVLMLVVAGLVVEVGHTAEHRRHLQVQTDAAALAAAQAFSLCGSNPSGAYDAMSGLADQYGGFGGANSFNQQVGTASGYAGNIASAYQSKAYPPGGTAISDDPDNIFLSTSPLDRQKMTCGDPSTASTCLAQTVTPCQFFDVKATEVGIHNVFNFGLSTTVHAHARVELKAVNEANGLLPLGEPDVRPQFVFATFVAESGLVTCTDQAGVPVPTCEEELVKGSTAGGQQQWVPSSPLKVTIPTGDLGVRIRLVGGSNPNAACDALYVECYDAGSANGLIHIRGWDASAAAPVVQDANLFTTGTCKNDPYFASADCLTGIFAKINLGAGQPVGQTIVWATIDGAGNYALTVDSSTPATGLHTWATGAQSIPVSGGGPHSIQLHWKASSCSKASCENNFGAAAGGDLIQRPFEATPDRSGPLFGVQVYDSGATPPSTFGPYSYQGGTVHSLGVTITTQGALLLSQPSDPPISLRVFKNVAGNSKVNQTINCDPNLPNLQSEIESGCGPTYKTQKPLTCPFPDKNSLWGSAQPWTCVVVGQGGSVGEVVHGLNQRIFGDKNAKNTPAECGISPVNWIRPNPNATPPVIGGFDETLHPDDKRVLPLFVTPLGSFSGDPGSGGKVVPVIDFGFFYVTGYSGDPCEGNDPNQDQVADGAVVRGHFIKFFPIDDLHPSGDNCDLTTITPCVGVLTR